jgi:hypothetical protein
MPLPPHPSPLPHNGGHNGGEGARRSGEGETSWPSYYPLKLSKTMKGEFLLVTDGLRCLIVNRQPGSFKVR